IEEMGMPERLLEFLAQKTDPTSYSGTSLAERWGYELVKGVSPIYLDLVNTIFTELKRFPPKVTALEITEWETRHIGRFRKIYAVLETVRVIPETYEEFDWRTIADAGLSVISLASPRHKEREQELFAEFLKQLKGDDRIRTIGKSVEMICKLKFAHEK